ncbi:hypothetical protein [Endozoicomonas ascidiicola]|nr:hypothetical protein [Endozoicomonas ascidiicola]
MSDNKTETALAELAIDIDTLKDMVEKQAHAIALMEEEINALKKSQGEK